MRNVLRAGALFWIALFLLPPAMANVPGGGSRGSPVTLAQEGRLVVLANGIVTATIDTAGAAVLSLKYAGHEMVSTSGRHSRIYFSMSGGKDYEQPAHCVYSVTRRSPDDADISCKRIYAPGDKQPDIDVHYVLRRGSPGLYVYAIVSHPPDYPDAGMGEWRMVWSMPDEGGDALLERIYVDEARHWRMPPRMTSPTPSRRASRRSSGSPPARDAGDIRL
ncbi:MAG: hypothetical protein JO250_11210 [Armatimonadetes bacterium]|nr:hypothetical protein [Armatimonadota bacterium]